MSTTHYGEHTGSNGWDDHDAVAIFGLHYLPNHWATNTYQAYKGRQETEWLRADGNRPFNGHKDILKALRYGPLVSDTIQAINRVRCRRVIDGQGNCSPTDAFLMLPNGEVGEAVLEGIKDYGIKVKDWSCFKGHTGSKRKIRRGKNEVALLSSFMEWKREISSL